jgi:hypothetical protein
MEKNTRSRNGMNEKRTHFSLIARRLTLMVLLISVVICASMPESMQAQGGQLSYRNTTFSAGSSPSAARIGDLDGDGRNDIAVINLQGTLQLFFNTGAGSFERTSINGLWTTTTSSVDIDIDDLNGDGRNDIAVAFATQRGAVSVLLNRGTRTFAAPVNYDACNSSKGVVIGDLDGDGDKDLADISQCSKASILLNNGQGNFALNGTYGTGSVSKSVALADFNRDGFKDIVYVNNTVNGSATVMFNNRNGTFGNPRWLYAGDLPDDLTVGDFDGDGNNDVAIANSYYSQILILLNNSTGSFPGYSEIYAGDTPTSITAGDFNADGLLDIAVTSQGTNSLSIILNQGAYNFSAPQRFNVGQAPVDIAAGRLDGDALVDLVTVNQASGSINVLFSGAGTPEPPPPAPRITLTASTRSTSRTKLVDLRWSGATDSTLYVYRNGSRIVTMSNSGSYTDELNKRTTGAFTYKVCGASSQVCSNEATVRF